MILNDELIKIGVVLFICRRIQFIANVLSILLHQESEMCR